MTNKDVNTDEIFVSVFMLTYRHADYIEQAINGVLTQQCTFPIELIIADDNSPDNTEEVVTNFLKDHPKKYLVRYVRHAENKGHLRRKKWNLYYRPAKDRSPLQKGFRVRSRYGS